jgi:hypothetical protein
MPGHPEFRHTKGVQITTGPLGQGLASAVDMAMASRYERGLFDPDAAPGTSPFDHFLDVIASDDDIEEGVTSEASSMAGTQQLGNLIVFYDHNQISIGHNTDMALSENIRNIRCATRSSSTPASWWTGGVRQTRCGGPSSTPGRSASPNARNCRTGCLPSRFALSTGDHNEYCRYNRLFFLEQSSDTARCLRLSIRLV